MQSNVASRGARVAGLAAGVALLCAGCFYSHHHHPGAYPEEVVERGGPPPWAPAHGQRRKHEDVYVHDRDHDGGVKVVFDSERGVYVVIGFPHHYFDAGYYYRVEGDRWEVSGAFEGPWLVVATEEVPLVLRHAHKKPKKKKHRYGSPARHAD